MYTFNKRTENEIKNTLSFSITAHTDRGYQGLFENLKKLQPGQQLIWEDRPYIKVKDSALPNDDAEVVIYSVDPRLVDRVMIKKDDIIFNFYLYKSDGIVLASQENKDIFNHLSTFRFREN
jgi:hypothetical protein